MNNTIETCAAFHLHHLLLSHLPVATFSLKALRFLTRSSWEVFLES